MGCVRGVHLSAQRLARTPVHDLAAEHGMRELRFYVNGQAKNLLARQIFGSVTRALGKTGLVADCSARRA